MRLRIDKRLTVLTLLCGVPLTGCMNGTAAEPVLGSQSIQDGPAADYPVVIGDSYSVDGVTYTPEDSLNYDRVGFVIADDPAAMGVTGAHRTLPLPSYVEVTSLSNGQTILVRIERRGPMTNAGLLALAPDALKQLDVGNRAPIRMRRVNPPEEHRAKLRAGNEAPLRMKTPKGLLDVLKRRLPEEGSASLGDPQQQQVSGKVPNEGVIASLDPDGEATEHQGTEPLADNGSDATSLDTQDELETVGAGETFAVQVGTFSIRSNADDLAEELGGYVETVGKFALVRIGPYASRGQAEQALAKLRSQGYSDAQIQSLD